MWGDEGEQAAPGDERGDGDGHGPLPVADFAAKGREQEGAEDEGEAGGEGEEEFFGDGGVFVDVEGV